MTGKYKDFARNYLFYARINYTGFSQDDSYLVSAASLPVHTIDPVETNWQGAKYKIATTHNFAEYSITFKADPSQDLRRKFASWTEKIHNPLNNIHGLPANYFGSLDLSQINGQGEPIMSYKFVGAWPSSIAEVTLDYGSKELTTFAVTFQYQYFVVDNIFGNTVKAEPVKLS
jgi:hypothetical protein